MAEVQKAALESYNKIKAERGEVTALDMFIAGRDWFKDQMMKGAIDTRIDKRLADMIGYTGSERVKIIIIKE